MEKASDAYKEEQAFVLTDGSTAPKEAQQEEHCSHGQHDVCSSEQQRISSHYLSKSSGIHYDPDSNS